MHYTTLITAFQIKKPYLKHFHKMRAIIRVNYNKEVQDRQLCIAGQPVIRDFFVCKLSRDDNASMKLNLLKPKCLL